MDNVLNFGDSWLENRTIDIFGDPEKICVKRIKYFLKVKA